MDAQEADLHWSHAQRQQVRENLACLAELFRYPCFLLCPEVQLRTTGKARPACGAMFSLFRDEILQAGLRFGHVRSEVEVGVSTIQERHVKRVACRVSGQASVRSIEGWELVSV